MLRWKCSEESCLQIFVPTRLWIQTHTHFGIILLLGRSTLKQMKLIQSKRVISSLLFPVRYKETIQNLNVSNKQWTLINVYVLPQRQSGAGNIVRAAKSRLTGSSLDRKKRENQRMHYCQQVEIAASGAIRKLNSLMQLLPRSKHHQTLMLHELTKGALELYTNLCMWNEQFVFFLRLTDDA